MSSIEKMAIQGVRSFGPDDSDKQVIEFFAPLTLILGPNGTGKTTIIECLKYMTTGDLPPGGKQNAAFIHDPKVAGETEVKAQIRLLFRDVQGQRCSATRSLTATQKAKKVEMKTLEGLITRKDKAGNPHSISSKCAEMDREMVSLLGVSQPVLDSVIFCHQEEANWPLSEGKALKTKFDDIFASTRYVKALEVIRKCRLEQTTEIKLFQTDIKYLKQNKDKATEIRENLEEQETRYLASKENVEKIMEKMEPIMEKLNQLRSRSQEIYKLQTRIEKMKSERAQIEKSQKEIQRNIKKQFTGSTTELKENLRDFADQVEEQESTLRKYESRMETLNNQITHVSDQKSDLLVEQGVLQQEAERHQRNIKQRDGLVEKLAEKYDLSGFTAPLSDRKVEQFLKHMEDEELEMEEKLRSRRAVHDEEELHIQTKIDELRNSKTKLETELSMKLETFDKNRQDIREIKGKLSRVDASADHLKDVQRDLKKVDRELTDAEKAVDLDSLKTEVVSLQKDKTEMDSKMKTLDTELNRLHLESTARTQLDVFKKERTSKTDNVRKLKSKIEDSVTHLIGRMPTENLRRELNECTSKLNQSIRSTNSELQTLRHNKTKKETQSKMQKEHLTTKADRLREFEEKMNNVSGHQNFDEGLTKLQADLRKAQDEKGHLKGIDYLYRKYQENLGKEDPPCPLCHRPFESQTEVDELVDELSSKLNLVPGKLNQVETKIERNRNRVDEMIELRPVRTEMVQLDSQIIPQLKKDIKSLVDEMERLSTDINDKEDVLETYSADEATAQSVLTDAAMIDKLQSELKDIDRKIAQQSSRLSGGDSDRGVHEVQKEREEIQDDLENVNRNLDRKRQKISEHSDRVQQLRSTLNELKGEKLQIESDLQQRTRLEENLVILESANDTLDREVKDSKQQIKPLQTSISDQEKHKQHIIQEKKKQYEEGMAQVNSVKERHRKVASYNQDIENYLKKGKDKLLEQNAENMDQIEQKANKVTKEQESVRLKIDQTKEDLATQKVRERELSDSLTVRQKQEEMDDLGRKITDLEGELGGLDVNNLSREVTDMETKQQRYTNEKQHAEGRQVGLQEQMRQLNKELRSEMYRDAEEKYQEKMIALRTTELANQDLDKYYKALDRTIMSYHEMKMADINKIIRELWRNTYKGNDIETIEICTDVEEGSGASKTKRTYNYRVVMKKGDTALDMRNRCSAGQKVLASLIIRLALAETFCLNCGILALDEPTTNLDRENIESLAYALVEIIKSRSRQRNFQLVVITHDEDFVELLGRSDYVEEFFKVRKNEYGCSQLVKARVEDLHSR